MTDWTPESPQPPPLDGAPSSQPPPLGGTPNVGSPWWRPRRSPKWWFSAGGGAVVAAILIPSIIVAAMGGGSTPNQVAAAPTSTPTAATDAPSYVATPVATPVPTPAPTLPATQPAAPTPAPTVDLASTGGQVFPDSRVIITSCVNHPAQPTMDPVTGAVGTAITLTGTITNTGTTTNDYVAVAILATAGRFNFGSPDTFAVNLLAPGQTRSWKTQGLITNNPTQPLTCSVTSVLSQPG
jgi:hypothetical protein